jgi:hypothetical protein
MGIYAYRGKGSMIDVPKQNFIPVLSTWKGHLLRPVQIIGKKS